MAMNGTLTSWEVPSGYLTNDGNSYAGARYSFEWTAEKKSAAVTTVSWKLYSRGRYSTPSQLWHNIYVNTIVNGTTTRIYTGEFAADGFSGTQYSFKDILRKEGSFDVYHDEVSGAGSFQVYFKFACYAYLNYHENTGTASLDTNRSKVQIIGYRNDGTTNTVTQTISINTNSTLSLTTPSRSGYYFRYWNTKADGSGTTYTNGTTVKLSDTLNLYAIWGNRYKVVYNGNGATSGSVSATTHYYGDPNSKLASNTYSKSFTITYNGNGGTSSLSSQVASFTGNGWNTRADGSGTAYSNNQAVNNLTTTQDGEVTLYAQYSGGSVTLPTATLNGYRFIGWADSSGNRYGAGASYTPAANTTLYAQWASSSSGGGGAVYIRINGEWKLSIS